MSDNPVDLPIGVARRRRIAAEAETLRPGLSADSVDNVGAGAPRRRRNRKPFGNQDQKLAYPNQEGFHLHWFNDVPGRLIRAEEAGYDKVLDPNGVPVSMVVGVSRGGGPLVAYLHKIPQEDYDEDMAANDSEVHDRLGQIKRGDFAKAKGREGDMQYAGSDRGDISIQSGNRR